MDRVTFANITFTIVNIIFTFANIIFTTLLLLVASRLGVMVSASKRHFHKGDIPQTALNYTAPLFFTEQAIFWKEKLSKYNPPKKNIVRSAATNLPKNLK